MDTGNRPGTGEWVRSLVVGFVQSSENTMGNDVNDRVFDLPLVGFARGDDPIFLEYKRDIGSFYLTPAEAFNVYYADSGVSPADLTVVSWVLPHIKQTKLDNRRERLYPSERWARGKAFGVIFNGKLQRHLIQTLEGIGCRAVAPCAPPHWAQQTSEKYGYASTWSERHAAYAAGLGTFGLCDGLITKVGKAMRCGSIVAHIAIPPTGRDYVSHTEYCLYLTDGSCGVYMTRCPAGAITSRGHDKEKCKAHCDGVCTELAKTTYNLEINTCGLCQTKVPCESGIPKRKQRADC